MNISSFVELAKISPYLVLPALFIFILWKVYKENNSFVQNIIKEKSEQFENISKSVNQLNSTLTAYITTFEKDNKLQHDVNIKEEGRILSSIEDKILTRIEATNEKLDQLRLDIAKGDLKK